MFKSMRSVFESAVNLIGHLIHWVPCLNCDYRFSVLTAPGIPFIGSPERHYSLTICNDCVENPQRLNPEHVAGNLGVLGWQASDIHMAEAAVRRHGNKVVPFERPNRVA